MNRISFAFRSFFSILFAGSLPADIAQAFGYSKHAPAKSTPNVPVPSPAAVKPAAPSAGPAEGAVQILGLLQRESRLVDFLMEDIAPYSDEQVGAAVRDVQTQARQTLDRYMHLAPVVDAVEETVVETAGLDNAAYKLIGNVPANGKAPNGLLRHKGWKALKVELPAAKPSLVLAAAELEVE
jgi:hypothetical protein